MVAQAGDRRAVGEEKGRYLFLLLCLTQFVFVIISYCQHTKCRLLRELEDSMTQI